MHLTQNTFKRREKKFLVDESLLPELEKRIMEHFEPDPHNVGGKPYEICNIYFDNERREITRHSNSKPFYKEKLRLRSYGTPTVSDNVFFEIKRKMNKIGTKRRTVMPLCKIYDFLDSGAIPEDESYINRRVLAEIDYFIKTNEVKPSVYIGYMRNAYFGKDDPSLRLTIDRDILTRHHDLRLDAGRYGEPLLPDGKVLMEIKFHGGVPMWFASLMSEFSLSFTRFSKVGKEFEASLKKENNNV